MMEKLNSAYMLVLDALVRIPTVTLLLLFAVLVLKDNWKLLPAQLAALVCITVAALLLGTPHPDLELPLPIHTVLRFLDVPSIALVWWFGLSLFKDDFRLGPLEWVGMAAICIPVLMFRMDELGYIPSVPPLLPYFIAGLSVAMMVHLSYITLRGRVDDMIEARRRVRFYFIIGLAIATVLIIIGERIFYADYPLLTNTSRAAITLPLILWAMVWILRAETNKFSFQPTVITERLGSKIDPRDKALHAALIEQMEQSQAFTEPGLSIRTLAETLKTPEHRLRQLINQGMGHRNFSGFINHYRIEAVTQAMAEPKNTRIPVLTLAMDVGFNSLAPFNRAFRTITGQTPTVYRNNLLSKNNDKTD